MKYNNEEAYQLFCNGHDIAFKHYETHLTDDFSLPKLLANYKNNLDELALYAAYSFRQNGISVEQLSTILLIRALKKEALSFGLQITVGYSNHPTFVDFKRCLNTKPSSEQYTLVVEFKKDTNPRMQGFLNLAQQLGLIVIQSRQENDLLIIPTEGYLQTHWEVNHGLSQRISMIPMVGKISIATIDKCMKKRWRPMEVSFPGIPNSLNFHGIEASSFFMSLHDRFHGKLISTIPYKVYNTFYKAIDTVREITGHHFSKELWDAVDMETGEFIRGSVDDAFFNNDPKISNTLNFLKLLAGVIYTENKTGGLFSPSALNDTMWLLLMDIKLHPESWQEHLCLATFGKAPEYKPFCDYLDMHIQTLKNLPTWEARIIFIKSQWFNVALKGDEQLEFVKTPSCYLQVNVNGAAFIAPKKIYIMLTHLELISWDIHRLNCLDIVGELIINPEHFLKKGDLLSIQLILEFCFKNSPKLFKELMGFNGGGKYTQGMLKPFYQSDTDRLVKLVNQIIPACELPSPVSVENNFTFFTAAKGGSLPNEIVFSNENHLGEIQESTTCNYTK